VAEDAADLGYVESEVDDQVAGEGVAQVVEAKWRPAVVVEPGELCGAPERAPADIAMAVGRPAGGRGHPVRAAREPAPLPVCAKQAGELRDERNVTQRGRGLRRDAPGGRAAVGARELCAHVDHAGREIDVVPDQAEHLRDAQAGVEDGRRHQPVGLGAGAEQALDLGAAEHALAAALRPWALVVLEPLDRVGDDPAAAAGEAQVFADRPVRRSSFSSSATSSTVSAAIARRPSAGSSWLSSW
jgi:hypothetical protein